MKDLTYGPLNKSLATQLLELVIKAAIYARNKTVFSIENGNMIATLGNIKVDISTLLNKANLTHIKLSEKDSKQLSTYTVKDKLLTFKEIQAIQDYIGPLYHQVNSFLRNDLSLLIYETNHQLRISFLRVAMLASALNKIDPVLTEGKLEPSYRGEKYITNAELKLRQSLIQNGGGLTKEHAFLSTSSDMHTSNFFKEKSFVTFDNLYGKPLGKRSSEYEHLLLPGCIKWTECTLKGGIPHFKATVVNPLIEGLDDPTKEEVALFKMVKAWAEAQGIISKQTEERKDDELFTEYTLKTVLAENYEPNPPPKEEDVPISSHTKKSVPFHISNIPKHISNIPKIHPSKINNLILLLAGVLGTLSYGTYATGLLPSLTAILIGATILSAIVLGGYCLKKLFAEPAEVKYKKIIKDQTKKYEELLKAFKSKHKLEQDQMFIAILDNFYENAPELKFDKTGKDIPENTYLKEKDKSFFMKWASKQITTVIKLKDNPTQRLDAEENIQKLAEKTFAP